jgi:hypothetical protein
MGNHACAIVGFGNVTDEVFGSRPAIAQPRGGRRRGLGISVDDENRCAFSGIRIGDCRADSATTTRDQRPPIGEPRASPHRSLA